MKNKKEKIIAMLLVVGLIVVTGSISYAAFKFSGLGSKVNTITTGSITMSYTESSNVLSMSGALPTTDATGKVRLNPGEYFDFTVSSSITGDTNINYEIAVEELDVSNAVSGLYDENGNVVYSWQELIDNGEISVTDGVLTCEGEHTHPNPGTKYDLEGILVIDDSVTSIAEYAFGCYCTSTGGSVGLTAIIIPDSVTSIGKYAFGGCSGLTAIAIPDSVTSIDSLALGYTFNKTFYYSGRATGSPWGATKATIKPYSSAPTNLLSRHPIANHIKFYLTKVDTEGNEEEVMAPSTYSAETESNTYTGRPAGMMSLYTSSMSASETNTYRLRMYVSEEYNPQGDGGNLVYKARVNVYGLAGDKIVAAGTYDSEGNLLKTWDELGINIEEDTTPPNSTVIDSNAVKLVIPEGITKIGSWQLANYVVDSNDLQEIILPSTLTSIGAGAFRGCKIESIKIPDSVTSIGSSAFQRCTGLTSIGPVGSGASVEIPDSVITVDTYTFSDCTGLTSIEIPDSVQVINYSAFEGCTGLTSIDLGNSVTSIGFRAFSKCTSLTSIYIPDGVTTIESAQYYNGLFYKCSSSLKIYCAASEAQSGWETYWNYYDENNALSVEYGVTREQYNALIGV